MSLTWWIAVLGSTAVAVQPTKRPSDDDRGKELYETLCQACHGSKNHGDGPATTALVHEVPDLAGKVQSNDTTLKLLMRGSGAMPSFEPTLDRDDARRVLKWMAKVHEQTAKAPPPEPEPDAPGAEGAPVQEGPGAPEDAVHADDARAPAAPAPADDAEPTEPEVTP